MIYVKYLIK